MARASSQEPPLPSSGRPPRQPTRRVGGTAEGRVAPRGDPVDMSPARSPSSVTASHSEDGFEMVEAPDAASVSEVSPALGAVSTPAEEQGRGWGRGRAGPRGASEAAAREDWDESREGSYGGTRPALRRLGSGGEGRRGGRAPTVQVTSPSLLALLLVLKSLLKHLAVLRRAAGFTGLWQEVSSTVVQVSRYQKCMEE